MSCRAITRLSCRPLTLTRQRHPSGGLSLALAPSSWPAPRRTSWGTRCLFIFRAHELCGTTPGALKLTELPASRPNGANVGNLGKARKRNTREKSPHVSGVSQQLHERTVRVRVERYRMQVKPLPLPPTLSGYGAPSRSSRWVEDDIILLRKARAN